jgi:hypothetical protein
VPAATGFNAYIQPPDKYFVEMAAPSTKFLEKLPQSQHYTDETIRAYARQLFNLYREVYKDEISNAVDTIKKGGEVEDEEDVAASAKDFINRAQRMIREWKQSEKWPDAISRTRELYGKIADRAARIEIRKLGQRGSLTAAERQEWIDQHIAEFTTKVAQTTRAEVRDYLARRMDEGELDPDVLAQEVEEHFSDFHDWKAARLARTEVRDVYNASSLLAAREIGVEKVQAIDAQRGPTDIDCENRDGQIFDLESAWQVVEHPNGTLAWRMLPVELSISRVPDMDHLASYDADSHTVYLSDKISRAEESKYLLSLGDVLVGSA